MFVDSMFAAKTVTSDHKDLIHDVAYDFYGKRMATCSSDQVVKIFDMNENGEWVCSSELKCHNASVWKVTWAHPEFGQIIATCSFDRTALVWEENVGDTIHGVQSTWVRRASLVDSRSSVTDVKFAPKIHGLQLATCSADGVVRIYEATDVMNLNHWSVMHKIQTNLSSCSCISWNPSPSRLHLPLIAVGSDDPNSSAGPKVMVFEYSENLRKWSKVEAIHSITEPVHDIAFSPNLGRSYHLLSVATKDLRIIVFKPVAKPDTVQNIPSTFEVRQAAQFDSHGGTVWRVSWNMLGTIVASSGDDGCVRLWKANYMDIWKCISTIKGEEISPYNPSEESSRSNNTTNTSYSALTAKQPPNNTRYFKLPASNHPSLIGFSHG